MINFLTFAGVMVVIVLFFAACAAIIIWAFKPQHSCIHRFDRVDDDNDNHYILVCSKCGKTKKMKK